MPSPLQIHIFHSENRAISVPSFPNILALPWRYVYYSGYVVAEGSIIPRVRSYSFIPVVDGRT